MMLLGIVACVLMLIRTLPLNRTFALRSSKKLLSILLVQEEKIKSACQTVSNGYKNHFELSVFVKTVICQKERLALRIWSRSQTVYEKEDHDPPDTDTDAGNYFLF